MSFALILPYLRPIEAFLLDEAISEVMVNPAGEVFVEQEGRLRRIPEAKLDPRLVEVAVKNIARLLGDDISEAMPILNARLPDGSRVAAMFPPCSVGGVTLTIRKFHNRWFSVSDLVDSGTLRRDAAELLVAAISDRKNVLVSGGTGTGKTTLLNALASLIPEEERILVIEETMELKLSKPNIVRWEARRANGGIPALPIRELVRASLRHRPDRLLVGEVRGGEAFDLLQALNTGHSGSLSTIHANTPRHAFSRFTNCVLEAGVQLPYAAIRANIAESIDFIVQVERRQGKRIVSELVRVSQYNPDTDKLDLTELFRAERDCTGHDIDPEVETILAGA